MDHGVIGCIEGFAVELVRQHRDRAAVFITHDAPVAVLARNLPALEVVGVAVRVAGWMPEDARVPVVLDPAHLDVVGNVAPRDVAAHAVPDDALAPEHTGIMIDALDWRVAEFEFVKARIERD